MVSLLLLLFLVKKETINIDIALHLHNLQRQYYVVNILGVCYPL